jgi:hypothetical protein
VTVDLLDRPGEDVWSGGISKFMALYQLQLLGAYLEHERDWSPIVNASEQELLATPDSLLGEIWDSRPTRYAHLIRMKVSGGYYLPVDFATPIWLAGEDWDEDDEEAIDHAESFGSGVALGRELDDLDVRLRAAGVPSGASAFGCLRVLQEGARESLKHNLPLLLW